MLFGQIEAWKSVGSYWLTKCIYDYEGEGYQGISILPWHMFCPNDYSGKLYTGGGLVYAVHERGTRRKRYHVRSPSWTMDSPRTLVGIAS
jgi:hypothetical protein